MPDAKPTGPFHLWTPRTDGRRGEFTRCGLAVTDGMLLLVVRAGGPEPPGVVICLDCVASPAQVLPRGQVLIVDDDPDIREALVDLFLDAGYRAAAVNDGAQAFRWLERHPGETRAIVLDLMMPVMDGLEFLRQKAQSPVLQGLPVVVVTAGGGCNEVLSAQKVCACLSKPVRAEQLLEIVGKCDVPAPRGN